MREVTFDFDIGESIKIKAINMLGKVDGLSIDNNGPMLRIVYWNDGCRNNVWMYPWEIEKVSEESERKSK
jgi:hypothetical protein